MTTIERKANELASLLADHRIVKVEMQSEHVVCVARVDLPEYGVVAGGTFHLFASSYTGYAYLVTNDGCTCPSYEFKHGTCKHSTAASQFTAARYFAHKAEAGRLVLEPIMREDDVVAHVEDSIRSGELNTKGSLNKCALRMEHIESLGRSIPMR
jgi:hypothetical protein